MKTNSEKVPTIGPDGIISGELVRKPKFVDLFTRIAGCTVEELKGYVGPEIVEGMEMDYPEIVKNFFPNGKVDAETAKIMRAKYEIEQSTRNPDFARYIFWKGLIDYKLEKDLVYKDSHPEARKALSIETSGLFGFIDNAYDQPAVWKMPTQEDALQKSNEDLLPGETLQSRQGYVNSQLEKAMQIAGDIRKGGNIPAFRWLYFWDKDEYGKDRPESAQKRKELKDETENSQILGTRNNLPIEGLTLEKINDHTDSPDEKDMHPLDSWTLMPPSGWIYKSMLLGFANPILLVSSLRPEEIGFARREYPTEYGENTTFYLVHEGKKQQLGNDLPLSDPKLEAVKGFFMPNEWEFTVFEPMPKVAVVDFKP